MRILILGDSRFRDSFGLALLKHKLKEHTTLVVSFDLCFQAVQLFKPHLLVLNNITGKRNNSLANYVKRQGGLVAVLATECRPNNDGLLKWYINQGKNEYLDLFLSWNETVTGLIPQAVTVGSPRFDIYQEPYKSLILSKQAFCEFYGIDSSKPIIGITSSFPQAKFAIQNSSFHVGDWKDLRMTTIDGNEDPALVAKLEYQSLEEYKFWIRHIIHESKEYSFIVKPHPLENSELWRQLCDETGARLIPGEYIFNFANACDLILAKAGCVTHMDSWLLGKPTVHALLGREYHSGASKESLEYMASASGPEEACDHIKVRSEKGGGRNYLDKYGFTVPNSAQKCADALLDLLDKKRPEVADITLQNEVDLNKMINQHNAERTVPQLDHLNHYGKSVTRSVIDSWLRKIEWLDRTSS